MHRSLLYFLSATQLSRSAASCPHKYDSWASGGVGPAPDSALISTNPGAFVLRRGGGEFGQSSSKKPLWFFLKFLHQSCAFFDRPAARCAPQLPQINIRKTT